MTPVDEKSLREIPDPKERYAAAVEEFYRARRERSAEIIELRNEVRYSLAYISELLNGYEITYLSKMFTGKRLFALWPPQLAVFSYFLYHMSCHEFLFGNPGVTMLPKVLSGAVELFRGLIREKQEEVLSYMESLVPVQREEEPRKNLRPLLLPAPKNPAVRALYQGNHKKLVQRRLSEAANDRVLLPTTCMGTPTVPAIRSTIAGYFSDRMADDFSAKTNTLMYFALALDTSVDQFCVVDYTQFTDLRIFGSDEIITDDGERKFVQKYLLLQEEDGLEEKVLQRLMGMASEA